MRVHFEKGPTTFASIVVFSGLFKQCEMDDEFPQSCASPTEVNGL